MVTSSQRVNRFKGYEARRVRTGPGRASPWEGPHLDLKAFKVILKDERRALWSDPRRVRAKSLRLPRDRLPLRQGGLKYRF